MAFDVGIEQGGEVILVRIKRGERPVVGGCLPLGEGGGDLEVLHANLVGGRGGG